MTPIYLEPKPEPYLVHHLENSQHSCASNNADNAGTHSSTIGGSPSLNLHLSAKNEATAKLEESAAAMKNDEQQHLARSNLSNPELTNMQPAPPSYNPYSPIYNGVGV